MPYPYPKKTKTYTKPTTQPGMGDLKLFESEQKKKPKWTWKKGPKTGLFGTQSNDGKNWGVMYGKGQNQLAPVATASTPAWQNNWNNIYNKYNYNATQMASGNYANTLAAKKAKAAARRKAGGGRQFGEAANPYTSPYNLGFLEYDNGGEYAGGYGSGSGYGGGYGRGGYGGGSGGTGNRMYYGSGGGYPQQYDIRRPTVSNIPRWMALIANWRITG